MATWTQRPWLADLLICPAHGVALTADGESMSCTRGHAFPVVGGIPRFTPSSSYADNFGFEWSTFPRLQLDDGSSRESEKTFRLQTGLSSKDVGGRLILDAGCGMGRFAHVVARWGGRVVGVDLSKAVEAAAENLAGFDDAGIAQADLWKLPFAPATFDLVFSLGVLHHTPNTFESLSRLATLVKPDGVLAIWVYSSRLRWTLAGGEILRPLTRRMDSRKLLRTVRTVAPRAHAIKQRLPKLARLVDVALPTSNHPHPEWRILDTFDWYSPRYQWKHTYAEVEGWFRRLGFERIERQPVPVSVRGHRPVDLSPVGDGWRSDSSNSANIE
jgi:SAM-dependent methyltransferase